MYCIMRVVRLESKQLRRLVEAMDDRVRWQEIEDFLLKNAARPATELIRVSIPGNYPHELLLLLLLLAAVIYYFVPK
jgi:hypothetical protein